MKKYRKVLNQEIERTFEFTADDVKALIAKRVSAAKAVSYTITINADGSAVAVLNQVR
jgi:hypothetical protein